MGDTSPVHRTICNPATLGTSDCRVPDLKRWRVSFKKAMQRYRRRRRTPPSERPTSATTVSAPQTLPGLQCFLTIQQPVSLPALTKSVTQCKAEELKWQFISLEPLPHCQPPGFQQGQQTFQKNGTKLSHRCSPSQAVHAPTFRHDTQNKGTGRSAG